MAKYRNKARFLEEAAYGIDELMTRDGRTQAWLARQMGVSRPYIHKIVEGSHNFTLETLADVYFALGRSVHIILGTDLDELRLPVDEAEPRVNQSGTVSNKTDVSGPFSIEAYRNQQSYSPTVFGHLTRTAIPIDNAIDGMVIHRAS